MQLAAEDLRSLEHVDPELFRSIIDKLHEEDKAAEVPNYVKGLFGPQRAFYDDTSSKRRAALTSRRAGKTEACAALLISAAKKHPGSLSLYLALSKSSARNIMWSTLMSMERRYNLGLVFKEIDGQLSIMVPCPGGVWSRLWLCGVANSVEGEKIRGVKLAICVIDEAGSFGDFLADLVEDIIGPCLLDLDASCIMIGTPTAVCWGFFWEITSGNGIGPDAAVAWSTHHWTVLDNPYIPHAKEWLEQKLKDNNWDKSFPRYRREWLGEWVDTSDQLVFPYDRSKNCYFNLPGDEDDRWITFMGIDIGIVDASAFVIASYRRGHPEIYIREVFKSSGLIPSAIAARILAFKEKYRISHVVMDTGGIGAGFAAECEQRYGLQIEQAEKTKKRAFVELVRGELLSGVIKINPRTCEPLLNEIARLVFNEKGDDYLAGRQDHCSDSFLYVVRAMMPYYRPKYNHEPLTMAQRYDKIQQDARKEALRSVRKTIRAKMRGNSFMKDIAAGR